MSEQKTLEDVRRFWDTRPCNIRHSSLQIGTPEYFDEVEHRKYFVEKHIPNFAEFAKWKDKRVLEIGFGIGTDAVNFARHGALYTGVELSIESLKIAQKRFEIFSLNGNLLQGDAENLQSLLPIQEFDLVYSFGVLHHTPDIKRALIEIKKFMSETTELKIMVYSSNSWKQSMINAGLDQPEAQFGCPVANSYSKQEITEILNECGLVISSIEQDHIFPYEIEAYKKYEYRKLPWFENMPIKIFNVIEKNFGWHLLINAKKRSLSIE